MIVVDTNVISYFYLATEYSSQAEQLFLKNQEWAAPVLWRSEFRNVLSIQIRHQHLSFGDALQIFQRAEVLLNQREFGVDYLKVLQLSMESGCSAYDCEFVNLAQDLDVPLVTMDKKILRCFEGTAVSIQDYFERY